jgi:hypothetical protein
MAKTTGPLFSLTASGSVGKTITYSQWKGRPYVRRLVKPLNPMLAAQMVVRNALRCIAQAIVWANLTTQVCPTATDTDKEKIKLITPDGFAWNGHLLGKAIGVNLDAYTAGMAIWTPFTTEKAAWTAAADALNPAMLGVPQVEEFGVPGTGLTSGNVFFMYRYGLFMLSLADEPGAVPPTYVAS